MTLSVETLDTIGLRCPLVLAHAKKKLSELTNGEVLRVVSSDPSSVIDFKVFTRQTGHALLKSWQEGNHFFFDLQKA